MSSGRISSSQGAGIPDADVEVSKVNLETAYDRFGQTGKFLGYRSTVSFRFLVGRLDAVEQLITSAVEAGASAKPRSIARLLDFALDLWWLRTQARESGYLCGGGYDVQHPSRLSRHRSRPSTARRYANGMSYARSRLH